MVPRLIVIAVVYLATLVGCGGGMNASNPGAPSSENAHECTWVDTHPGEILERVAAGFISSATQATFSAIFSQEQLTQCRVCHGSDFLGAAGGAAGPACLDCHIIDPIRYSAGCYSCHGGVGNNPEDTSQISVGNYSKFYALYSSARRGNPVDQDFFNSAASGIIHNRLSPSFPRNHDPLPYVFSNYSTGNGTVVPMNESCRYCHGAEGSGATANLHHQQEVIERHGCSDCHDYQRDPVTGQFVLVVYRDCSKCHS